ncbi:murein L,D-transpeptidase family protein [Stappia sp. 28M-7]|uniref:L,D-transpeptidase family protein n=1 Tax=Stappia sp. 28M-7 TaxID=2762596 RepID=UPI00163C6F30|nr:L,D-transpeptidase family protein [Stappia sp. 28M-7]MBC2858224.1 L,D-transpeptidase family protein [Stappia sp. 28M-7]
MRYRLLKTAFLILSAAASVAADFAFSRSAAADQAAAQIEEPRVEKVLVEKGERRLQLLDASGAVLKSYTIALGGDPLGHKQREGDGRTPEGRYTIDWRNPQSAYHLSLHISYPDQDDTRRANERSEDPGGMIMIHGMRNGLGWLGFLHQYVDWTDGCIAVTNAEMDEIWRLVPNGTPIEIRP